MDLWLQHDVQAVAFDLAVAAPDLATDAGLRSAVVVSLFTDRRAAEDDALPDDSGDRRGWWGDAHPDVSGDRIGSRLWLLRRSKLTPETLRRAREYAEEALQWLVDDAVASEVTATAEQPRRGVLALTVTIRRPGADAETHRFETLWETV